MSNKRTVFFLILTILYLIFISPVSISVFQYYDNELERKAISQNYNPITLSSHADLDLDGEADYLRLSSSKVQLLSEQSNHTAPTILWQSPPDWQIAQAAITDLNRDGKPEMTLLVWRPFRPLPIDTYLPVAQSHTDFQNKDGQSCQIILIGWKNDQFRELWAGSALAEPIISFAVADLDGDGLQELITLDGRYKDGRKQPAHSLSVWQWNSFGFSLQDRKRGSFTTFIISSAADGNAIVAH